MKAGIYLRQSLDVQEGIERQRSRCTALIEARGWELVAEYADNDTSASKVRGEGTDWARMLADAQSGQIDVVIAVNLDRLLRTQTDLTALIESGAKVTTLEGEIDLTSASGEMQAAVLTAMARFEVRRKGERQQRASDDRAAKGLPTAHPGYGYVRADGKDVVDPAQAAVIREAARRVLAGESMRSIAADLNERGIRSPRTVDRDRKAARKNAVSLTAPIPWQGATLRQMLRRPSLTGLRTHRGIVMGEFNKKMHPPILDRDTHDRLIALFDDPTRSASSRVGHPPKYLLAGIAHCGLCGESLGGRMKRLPPWEPKPGQKSKPVKAAYACGTCHKVRRVQEPVDALVTEVLLRRLEREDAADLFTTGDPKGVREARDAIKAVNARLASAADMFADGTIDAEQLSRITAKGRSDRDALEQALHDALPPVIPREAVGTHAREAWAGYDPERRRAIVSALMRVTILPVGSGATFDPEGVRIEWLSEAT